LYQSFTKFAVSRVLDQIFQCPIDSEIDLTVTVAEKLLNTEY